MEGEKKERKRASKKSQTGEVGKVPYINSKEITHDLSFWKIKHENPGIWVEGKERLTRLRGH